MARYIDADKVMEEINQTGGHNLSEWSTLGVKALIDRQPTADVAPRSEYDAVVSAVDNSTKEFLKLHDDYQKQKSEVEQLIYKLECLLCHATGGKLSKHTYDLRTMETAVTDYIQESYNEGYKDSKTDGAEEIFAELDEALAYCLEAHPFAIARYNEIKKKYIEE